MFTGDPLSPIGIALDFISRLDEMTNGQGTEWRDVDISAALTNRLRRGRIRRAEEAKRKNAIERERRSAVTPTRPYEWGKRCGPFGSYSLIVDSPVRRAALAASNTL
ncbi:hypothetical protein [Paraburkholderia sp. D1E]|uniref:hypothetical protein n=1 Tax=Paraburkholderia sp. D1E TaxID=3461398 RepID=UPI0040462103